LLADAVACSSKPQIATLIHKQTPDRGEWVIDQDQDHNNGACHEVEQSRGERKVVEVLKRESLAEPHLAALRREQKTIRPQRCSYETLQQREVQLSIVGRILIGR